MDQIESLDTEAEQARGSKLRIHQQGKVTGATQQSEGRGASPVLGELEKLGMDNSALKAYLAFQQKMGVAFGYLVGSLFTAGGAMGLLTSFTTAAVPSNMHPGSSAWFPALACISGVLAIISSRKLSRTL